MVRVGRAPSEPRDSRGSEVASPSYCAFRWRNYLECINRGKREGDGVRFRNDAGTITAFSVILVGVFSAFLSPLGVAQDEPAKEGGQRKDDADYMTLENPIAYTEKSIRRGKIFYSRLCAACHGPKGKGEMDVVADATDLTTPKFWTGGTAEGQIFRSIRDGAGDSMPPFKFQIRREDDMWHMVNFVQSLWPQSVRPTLEAIDAGKKSSGK